MNEICKETRGLSCCLDERTQILMADGMRKEIRKITVGDYIFYADCNFCMVENIMQGREENCLEISCENGFFCYRHTRTPLFDDARLDNSFRD